MSKPPEHVVIDALVVRVGTLEDVLRALVDEAAPIAEHWRIGHFDDVVLAGKRLGSDDGVWEVTRHSLVALDAEVSAAYATLDPVEALDLLDEYVCKACHEQDTMERWQHEAR